jgi:hypothetical protein
MIATRKMILDNGACRAVEQAEHVIDLFTEEKIADHGGLHANASIRLCSMERGYIWPSSPQPVSPARSPLFGLDPSPDPALCGPDLSPAWAACRARSSFQHVGTAWARPVSKQAQIRPV